jgi:hypothetical protein
MCEQKPKRQGNSRTSSSHKRSGAQTEVPGSITTGQSGEDALPEYGKSQEGQKGPKVDHVYPFYFGLTIDQGHLVAAFQSHMDTSVACVSDRKVCSKHMHADLLASLSDNEESEEVVKFQDELPGKGDRPYTVWAPVFKELEENMGKWGIVQECENPLEAQKVRQRLTVAMTKANFQNTATGKNIRYRTAVRGSTVYAICEEASPTN